MAAWLRWFTHPIRRVHTEQRAPGLVTLAWTTPEPSPTRISGPDGSWLYAADAPERDHRVTLAGGPGSDVEVHIHADGVREAVQVRF